MDEEGYAGKRAQRAENLEPDHCGACFGHFAAGWGKLCLDTIAISKIFKRNRAVTCDLKRRRLDQTDSMLALVYADHVGEGGAGGQGAAALPSAAREAARLEASTLGRN